MPFNPPKNPRNKNFEKTKKFAGDIILHVYPKSRSYNAQFLKYGIRQTDIFVILGHFLPFLPLDNLQNQNFNIERNTWRYHFTYLHHKWQSYDVWFLRYGEEQTSFSVILDCFFALFTHRAVVPYGWPENQNFEKNEKHT